MLTDSSLEKSEKRRDIVHLSILLGTALCIGVYLICTTVLVAKDSITFVRYAQALATSPSATMGHEYQHPGYPFLILTAQRIVAKLFDCSSPLCWIHSAQAVTLIFRLLAVAALYFVGRKITGQVSSFWGVLILILLPKPAHVGSDALSDWPHMFFLATGFLLLIYAASGKKWWLFGLVGLISGLGYLVRPECVQLVVFGLLWLGLQLFRTKRTMSLQKAALALVVLLVGFAVAAGPYMKLKGGMFPKKQLVQLSPGAKFDQVCEPQGPMPSTGMYTAGFAPSDIAGAIRKLIERVGDTLMWFVVLPLVIGLYKYYRKGRWYEPDKFFSTVLICLNIAVMILLYCKYGYMSRRHTLPLVVFTIFHVPVGLRSLACWLQEKFSEKIKSSFSIKADTNFWFVVLFVSCALICAPKLLRPIRTGRRNYRQAAQWLTDNTDAGDIIAASDHRIIFYTGREGIPYEGRVISKDARYVVEVLKKGAQSTIGSEELAVAKIFDSPDGKSKIVIYSN